MNKTVAIDSISHRKGDKSKYREDNLGVTQNPDCGVVCLRKCINVS